MTSYSTLFPPNFMIATPHTIMTMRCQASPLSYLRPGLEVTSDSGNFLSHRQRHWWRLSLAFPRSPLLRKRYKNLHSLRSITSTSRNYLEYLIITISHAISSFSRTQQQAGSTRPHGVSPLSSHVELMISRKSSQYCFDGLC